MKNNCSICYGRREVTVDYILPKSARHKDENGKEVKSYSVKQACSCTFGNVSKTEDEIQIACGIPLTTK